jgi:hypothetical protein
LAGGKDRGAEFFLQKIKLRLGRSSQDVFFLPGRIELGRTGISVIPGVVLRSLLAENQTDYILGMPLVKLLLLLRRNHVIGRGDDLAEVADFSSIIRDPAERDNHSHFSFSPFLMVS